jgi:hypothetical protein
MGASERIAALRRARERQARIESATLRAMKAQASLDRTVEAKAHAIERYDERVADAEALSAGEIADLARVCGSAEAAAEILGWTVVDVRRVIKAAKERIAAARHPDAGGSDVSRT